MAIDWKEFHRAEGKYYETPDPEQCSECLELIQHCECCSDCWNKPDFCICDPTPWCHVCGAMEKIKCKCGDYADNY